MKALCFDFLSRKDRIKTKVHFCFLYLIFTKFSTKLTLKYQDFNILNFQGLLKFTSGDISIQTLNSKLALCKIPLLLGCLPYSYVTAY